MVITDHLIIFLQQLTVCMCACIRTDRTCTHRTICTIMVTTQALLSCSSSNSSMNSTQSTSTTIYAYYSLSFANFGAAAAAPILYSVAQFPVRRPVSPVRHVRRASPTPPGRPVRPERTTAPRRISRPFRIVVHDRGRVASREGINRVEQPAPSRCNPVIGTRCVSRQPHNRPAARTGLPNGIGANLMDCDNCRSATTAEKNTVPLNSPRVNDGRRLKTHWSLRIRGAGSGRTERRQHRAVQHGCHRTFARVDVSGETGRSR